MLNLNIRTLNSPTSASPKTLAAIRPKPHSMDILKEIETQITSTKVEDNSIYLDQIYNHIDRAEKYYLKGHTDEHYFNDVIYRSNQAFEGALKEAYKVLANKTEDELHKTTPYKIENHFKDNSIFRDRVLQLFENYRQEWRNKSTHDYKLVFDENEAFIALTSVSSFVHLLLKQIQEKLAFNNEQKRLALQQDKLKEIQQTILAKGETLAEKVVKVVTEFVERNESITSQQILEIEVLGMLHGFLSMANEDLQIAREPKLVMSNKYLRPDFVIEYANEKIVLEVKRRFERQKLKETTEQLIDYLEAANTTEGIIYFVKTVDGKPVVSIDRHEHLRDGNTYVVFTITT